MQRMNQQTLDDQESGRSYPPIYPMKKYIERRYLYHTQLLLNSKKQFAEYWKSFVITKQIKMIKWLSL